LSFLPNRTPLAFALLRSSSVLARINSLSNSARPPRTVNINPPCGVVVSAQWSASERKPAPAFPTRSRARAWRTGSYTSTSWRDSGGDEASGDPNHKLQHRKQSPPPIESPHSPIMRNINSRKSCRSFKVEVTPRLPPGHDRGTSEVCLNLAAGHARARIILPALLL
jgi:hypothetical protein